MAPVSQPNHDVVEKHVKNIIQDLTEIMVAITQYDNTSLPTKGVLERQVPQAYNSIRDISRLTAPSTSISLPAVPPELIQYVDNGRNPDIYTREFVELARKGNQLMKGKMEAFASFRDVLAGEMIKVCPELEEDARDVVVKTGGRVEGLPKGTGLQ